MSSNCNTLQ